MYSASDLRKGLKVEIDGEPYVVVSFAFSKPGKGQALYRTKMKNMINGNGYEKTYRSNDKFKKAQSIEGCKYIQIFAPCPPGWGYLAEDSIEIARLAVKTGFWILYEIENGILTLSKKSKSLVDPEKRLPIIEYISKQKRFTGISEKTLIEIQERVDNDWEKIVAKLDCQARET